MIISDDGYFQLYGILCAFFFIFAKKDELIFKKFQIEQFPGVFEIIMKYNDIK